MYNRNDQKMPTDRYAFPCRCRPAIDGIVEMPKAPAGSQNHLLLLLSLLGLPFRIAPCYTPQLLRPIPPFHQTRRLIQAPTHSPSSKTYLTSSPGLPAQTCIQRTQKTPPHVVCLALAPRGSDWSDGDPGLRLGGRFDLH